MKSISLLGLSILLLTSGCPFGPGFQPPPPDDCSSPRALDGITSIEVGALQPGDGASVFVPWQDGEIVERTSGAQGGTMLGVMLSLRGSNLPSCMRHDMELTWNGDLLASTDYPVNTYAEADGTRATSPIWLVFDDSMYPEQGDELELVLHVGGFEIRRTLVIEAPRPVNVSVREGPVLTAGLEYTLDIKFDYWVFTDVTVTIESSDPAVVRPLTPTLQVMQSFDNGFDAETTLEALAPGGPVTIRATANGRTVETEVTVQ